MQKLATLVTFLALLSLSTEARAARNSDFTTDARADKQAADDPKPVTKVITTDEGDVFDCVKLEDQLGLDHPILKNYKIPTEFNLPKLEFGPWSLSRISSVNCPHGTVPKRMNPIGSARNGTSFRHSRFQGNAAPKSTLKFTTDEPGVVTVDAGKYVEVDAAGAIGQIQVFKPIVESIASEFSGAFVGIESGTEFIRAGVVVYPSLYGDDNPRFSIQRSKGAKPCFDLNNCGFVVLSNVIGVGERFKDVSNASQRFYVDIRIYQNKTMGGWALFVNQQTLVGYWPNTLFQSLNSGIGKKVVWTGIIANSNPQKRYTKTQMGNGLLPTLENINSLKAAIFAFPLYYDLNLNPSFSMPKDSSPSKCYAVSTVILDSQNYPFFLYGGSGYDTGCKEAVVIPSPPPESPPPDIPTREVFLNPPVPQKHRNRYFRYASYRYTGTAQKPNWDLTAEIDWSKKIEVNPVDDQGECNACWAFATADAFEFAHTIATDTLVRVSKQQLLDCAVPNNNGSCEGGWPTDAFEFMATTGIVTRKLYSYIANNQDCQPLGSPDIPKYTVSMYEEIDFYGSFGLILAVQNQPVIVNLQGSSSVFQNYPGGIFEDSKCFTNMVDHSVVVVGYNLFGGDKPHWIIRNSFGESWGEKGYMRIAYTGGDGICGMHTTPAYYPVLPYNYQGVVDPCKKLNPCGAGNCTRNARTGKNLCECPDFFVAVTSLDGTQTCAPVLQCETRAFNPCGNGVCVNDEKGGYACICPPGFAQDAAFVNNDDLTCVPATSSNRLLFYTTRGAETCRLLWLTYRLNEAQFRRQNPRINCSQLRPGTRVNVTQSGTFRNCSVTYTWNRGDTCDTIARLFKITRQQLSNLNPGFECTNAIPGFQLCVKEGTPIDYDLPCAQFYGVQNNDTCQSIIQKNNIDPFTFFVLNRGINCQSLSPSLSGDRKGIFTDQVCIVTSYIGGARCSRGRPSKIRRGDTCPSIIKNYFGRSASAFRRCNRLTCNRLKVGTPYCRC